MSGLLERIARRRRASASRRLGPPSSRSGAASPCNGAGPSVESAPVAEGSSVAALDETPSVEGTEAPTNPAEESSVTEAREKMPGGVASPRGTTEPSSEGADEALTSPVEAAEEALPAPVDAAEEAPAGHVEQAPAKHVEEAIEVQAASEEAASVAQEAPAAPPQPQPDPVEPSPAPVEPPAAPPEPSPGEPSPPPGPTLLGRGRIRRRVKYLRRLREVQLREVGGFMVELYRFGRDRPDLLQAKLQAARSTDRELRALERALGEKLPIAELRQAGIGGACSNCGAVYGSADRYCASCGNRLSRRA